MLMVNHFITEVVKWILLKLLRAKKGQNHQKEMNLPAGTVHSFPPVKEVPPQRVSSSLKHDLNNQESPLAQRIQPDLKTRMTETV